MNKTQIENLNEIVSRGGAILSSHWTSGSGRYITRRVLPPLCEEVPVSEMNRLKGIVAKTAKRLLKDYPRARKLIVCTNIRAANKAIKRLDS